MRNLLVFAHRGAPATAFEQNTLTAFSTALAAGAKGLESDIGMTLDGVPVLWHQGLSLRRRGHIEQLRLDQLPEHIATLADLYDTCGTRFDLALDMAHPAAVDAVVALVTERNAAHHTWLTFWNVTRLSQWRRQWPDIRLVYPTMPLFPGSFARLCSRLRGAGVDAVNLHYRMCRYRHVQIAHSHGLLIFAWGVRGRHAERMAAQGVDGLFCNDLEGVVRLTQAPE